MQTDLYDKGFSSSWLSRVTCNWWNRAYPRGYISSPSLASAEINFSVENRDTPQCPVHPATVKLETFASMKKMFMYFANGSDLLKFLAVK